VRPLAASPLSRVQPTEAARAARKDAEQANPGVVHHRAHFEPKRPTGADSHDPVLRSARPAQSILPSIKSRSVPANPLRKSAPDLPTGKAGGLPVPEAALIEAMLWQNQAAQLAADANLTPMARARGANGRGARGAAQSARSKSVPPSKMDPQLMAAVLGMQPLLIMANMQQMGMLQDLPGTRRVVKVEGGRSVGWRKVRCEERCHATQAGADAARARSTAHSSCACAGKRLPAASARHFNGGPPMLNPVSSVANPYDMQSMLQRAMEVEAAQSAAMAAKAQRADRAVAVNRANGQRAARR